MRGFYMQNNIDIKIHINSLDDDNTPMPEDYLGYLVVLSPQKWDDFGFKTTFKLSIINFSKLDNPTQDFGVIKLAVKNQIPSQLPMEDAFFQEYLSKNVEDRILDQLPENIFTLPEYDKLYEDIENYFSNNDLLIHNFYTKIRDILKNNLQSKITTEDFFNQSFKRTLCFMSHEEFLWLYQQTRPMRIFQQQIAQAHKIASIEYNGFLNEDISIMLHGFLIATLENYLSTTFIKTVLANDELIFKQAIRDGKVKDTKFKIEELPNWQDTLKAKVRKSLEEMSFHNIEAVMPLYINVLNCTFPENFSWLIDAIKIRHDCAHRAGYNTSGTKLNITNENIFELIEKLNEFAKIIEEQVNVNPKY